VDVDPVGAGAVDRAHLLAEPRQVRRKDRRRNHERPHHGRTMKRCTAFANPSFSLPSVTTLARALTSSLALPIAIEKPLSRNISTSFGMSPMVAICEGGMSKCLARV